MRRVALLGAGYIATKHIAALQALKNVQIIAICDLNRTAAQEMSQVAGSCAVFSDFEKMMDETQPDVVHILLPPDKHFEYGEKVLKKGVGAFLEKPMALSHEECHQLTALAEKQKVPLGIDHNYLFFACYTQLKELIAKGKLGALDHVTLTWQKGLDVVLQGPFDHWMLRDPKNLCFETGPHLFSILFDLLGQLEFTHIEVSDPFVLPNGRTIWRRWMGLGYKDKHCVEWRMSAASGFDEHSLEVRGKAGFAKADFERDSLVVKQHTDYPRPFDLFFMAQGESKQVKQSSYSQLWNYLKSKCKWTPFGDPFSKSIGESIRAFYQGSDPRLSPAFATQVIEACEKMAQATPKASVTKATSPVQKPADIVVFGGSGFIGKALVSKLAEKGYSVKVFLRKKSDLPATVVFGDLHDSKAVKDALVGAKTVFHLARTHGNKWKNYEQEQIAATRLLAIECQKAGVERFIYTSTIDLYFAGSKEQIITEKTPIDPKIATRNYYAQAKAAEEHLLKELALPLVIVRPGIVIGEGASPYHWGVGMWAHGSICRLWGKGNHSLPFVLVDDVAEGLIRCMEVSGIEGESFNLIGEPLLTAKEYIQALEEASKTHFKVYQTPIWQFYISDCLKWGAKWLLRYPERKLPSYRDWLSRTQLSPYDCSKAKDVLGWNPQAKRDHLISEGIEKPAKRWCV